MTLSNENIVAKNIKFKKNVVTTYAIICDVRNVFEPFVLGYYIKINRI